MKATIELNMVDHRGLPYKRRHYIDMPSREYDDGWARKVIADLAKELGKQFARTTMEFDNACVFFSHGDVLVADFVWSGMFSEAFIMARGKA